MSLRDEFRDMVSRLTSQFAAPPIEKIFFPPFYKGGQPKESEFMALMLADGTVGVSYVLLPDDMMEHYLSLKPAGFIGKSPRDFACLFGSDDPIENMLSLAALNAVCQHVIKLTDFPVDSATDSLGLLSIEQADRVGMVGFFSPLIKIVEEAQASLTIIEKQEKYIQQFPNLHISLDPAGLHGCNKVLCTSATVLNDTLDEILANCPDDAKVSIIGPTAGYFPDPLFKRGVDVMGGTLIKDGELFMSLIAEKKRWSPATQKFCFLKAAYPGMPDKVLSNE